jgi:flagellar biosynthetic protein FliQ
MDPTDAMEVARSGVMVTLTIAGPMLMASLIVGVVIGLFQALTQIQEMTLTFVPKLVVLGIVMLLSLPMIGQAMSGFTMDLAERIVAG